MSDEGRRITDEINADPDEVAKLRRALQQAEEGPYWVKRNERWVRVTRSKPRDPRPPG